MNNDKLQSKTIEYLRFPLIVLVVFIHAYGLVTVPQEVQAKQESLLFYQIVEFLISQILARIAVPMFFLISGFLYFYKLKDWSKDVYITKTKKRFHSLIIPHLFWNFAIMMLFLLAENLPMTSGLFSGQFLKVSDYNFFDFLNVFWERPGTDEPFVYPFWFIRDLIVIVLLSPLVYYMIKYTKFIGLMLLGVCWFFKLFSIPGCSTVGLFFFSLGAYFSLNRMNLIDFSNYFFKLSLFAYPFLMFADFFSRNLSFHSYIHHIGVLVGILFLFNIIAFGLQKGKLRISAFLSSASFFIFAFHEPWLTFSKKFLFLILDPNNQISALVVYFGSATLIIFVALACYKILDKIAPKLLKGVSGGRK